MSVAEFVSNAAYSSRASFAVVAVVITGLAVRGGFRWVSAPKLSLPGRRLVRNVVYTGWALLLGLIIGTGVLVVIACSPATPTAPGREPPSVRIVLWNPNASDWGRYPVRDASGKVSRVPARRKLYANFEQSISCRPK
jgi:hypothetical protein